MRIQSIEFRNIASYGGQLQRLDFEDNQSHLYLVLGGNGYGKCLSPDTRVEIRINDLEVEEKFKEFLKNKYSK